MTGNLKMTQATEKISSVSVGLLNGTYVLASQEGTIWLGKGTKLSNVLYVPSLQCNLISIAKLCKELNCSMTFFDEFCVLQDYTLRTLIFMSEQQGGACYFNDGSLMEKVNVVNSSTLWYKHLGQPSSEVLSLLPSSLGVNFDKEHNNMCETCYRAK